MRAAHDNEQRASTGQPAERPSEAFRQIDCESSKAYAAYKAYAKLGSERTIAKAAKKVGKCARLLERWSSRFRWVERASKWDDYVAKAEAKAIGEQAQKIVAEWAERDQAMREAILKMAQRLRERAKVMMAYPLITASNDGKMIMNPAAWNLGYAPELAEAASDCEAMALRSLADWAKIRAKALGPDAQRQPAQKGRVP